MRNSRITREQSELVKLLKPATRSKLQVNRPHESDCEILKLSSRLFLASSVDSFSDEWSVGLYRKPETLARLCVHGTVSDLVVSGSTPLGFLFSPQWGFDDLKNFKARIFKTVIQELKNINIPLLGGDEGTAPELNLTGVILGTSKKKPVTRLGIKPGQWLCTLGKFGVGPALGFQYLMKQKQPWLTEDLFCPTAQTAAIPTLLKYAKASMDSSDGLCTTLHFLAELNGVKFEIDAEAVMAHPAAARFCRENSLPFMSLWYGEIGDYQPIFTLDPKDFTRFQKSVPTVRKIGVVLPRSSKNHLVSSNSETRPFFPGKFLQLRRSTMPEIKKAFHEMIHWLKREMR